MEYARLGRTALRVSRLCLGTMNFGPETDEPTAHRIMDRAHDLGINFFDTANVYGERLGEGVTEQIIGRWFAQGGTRRDRTVIATKVYCPMGDWPNQSRLSALHIVRACEASLRRLQTDRIDLYQLHHIDRDASWDEIWQAMETLVAQGKVLYVGSSNFAGWHIAQANESAKARHFLGLVSEQSLYNLMDRMIELEVIPACQSYGLGLLPWSPLNGGALAGAVRKAKSGRRASADTQQMLARHHARVEAYEGLCAERGLAPADVALAWLLAQPAVTAPIVGPRDLAQLEQAEAACGIDLDRDLLQRLDSIFPGPGGAAPEAYAW